MGNWANWCCHGGPCWKVEDNFNRADGTDIGSLEERSGDWTINSQKLREAGTPGALAIHTSPHPKDDWTGIAAVDIIGIVQDVAYLVVIHYLDDSNYDFASYKYDGTWGWVSVGQVVAGVTTTLDTVQLDPPDPPTGNDRLHVCCNKGGIEGYVASQSAVAWSCNITDGGGRRAGVGRGATTTGAIEFDNFLFEEHYATNTKCPHCLCDCQDNCLKKILVMTFTATGDCAACLDGLEFDSVAADVDKEYRWITSLPDADDCTQPLKDYEWALDCALAGSTSCDEWLLCNGSYYTAEGDWELPGCVYPTTGGGEYPNLATCSCNPFSLVYGPFEIERPGAGVVCTYSITITEKA